MSFVEGEKIMPVRGVRKEITKVVLSWDGVTAQPHRFGGTEYLLGRREN
jgi:hypothetical protein